MAWTTPVTVNPGDAILASLWNEQVRDNLTALPRGVLLIHTLTSGFTTSATHTTFQNEGLTGSVSYDANRKLRVTIRVNPYAFGGLQDVLYRVRRGSTTVATFYISQASLTTTIANNMVFTHTFDGPSTAATETFLVQVAAATNNTSIVSYADSTYVRQLVVEDVGEQ